jgi:hypothetical protein
VLGLCEMPLFVVPWCPLRYGSSVVYVIGPAQRAGLREGSRIHNAESADCLVQSGHFLDTRPDRFERSLHRSCG